MPDDTKDTRSDDDISPMEAQNTAQRHTGPATPPLRDSKGGEEHGGKKLEGAPIRPGGEAEARDDL